MSKDGSINEYFEKVPCPVTLEGEFAMKGIAAALTLDSNTHIIITAPNWEILRRAWQKIVSVPLDEKKAIIVCEALIGKLDYSDIEPKPPINTEPLPPHGFYWYIHPESGCCFLEYDNFSSSDGMTNQLGPAMRETINECKILLRVAGWEKDAINKLNISNEDPIPF